MDNTSTGTSLAERIMAGDSAAEEELVNTYRRALVAIARVRTRDGQAAQDLAQQVLIEALKALRAGKLREIEKLPAYIEGIAHNVINSFIRTRTRKSECALDDAELLSSDPVGQYETEERRRFLQREVEMLSALDQKILFWSLIDGYPLSEIADRLEMTHDAVRTRKSRAIRKLKKRFGHASQK